MHDGVKDKDLTREQIIARNLKVVDAHFHNETPESVDKAIALYDDEIVWEAPLRGVLLTDPVEIIYGDFQDGQIHQGYGAAAVRDRRIRLRRPDRRC